MGIIIIKHYITEVEKQNKFYEKKEGWTEIKKYGKICIRNDVVKLVFEEID